MCTKFITCLEANSAPKFDLLTNVSDYLLMYEEQNKGQLYEMHLNAIFKFYADSSARKKEFNSIAFSSDPEKFANLDDPLRNKKQTLSVCLDFRFNSLADVKKVRWKSVAPWYREVTNGLNLFGYCQNEGCTIRGELFVVNKGYGRFKFDEMVTTIKCPVCQQDDL